MFIVLTSPNDGSQFWAWRHFATAAPDDRSTASDERRRARGPNPDHRGHVAETAAGPGRRRPFSRDGPVWPIPDVVVSLSAPEPGPENLPAKKAGEPDRRRGKSGQGIRTRAPAGCRYPAAAEPGPYLAPIRATIGCPDARRFPVTEERRSSLAWNVRFPPDPSILETHFPPLLPLPQTASHSHCAPSATRPASTARPAFPAAPAVPPGPPAGWEPPPRAASGKPAGEPDRSWRKRPAASSVHPGP